MGVTSYSNANGSIDAAEFLVDKLKNSKSNDEFFDHMNS